MKSERDLLKAAAAALGLQVWWTSGYGGRFLRMRTCPVIWDPWRDDGDCARMEAELGIDVGWSDHGVEARSPGCRAFRMESFADHSGGRNAARRAASVRVAAAMPEKRP